MANLLGTMLATFAGHQLKGLLIFYIGYLFNLVLLQQNAIIKHCTISTVFKSLFSDYYNRYNAAISTIV